MRARAWVQFGYCAAGAGLGPKDTPRSPPLHGGVPLKVSSKDAAVTTFTVPRGRHMSTRWAVGATRQTGPGMATFTGKPTATAQKLRGGYYTPEPLARLRGAWGAAAGQRGGGRDRGRGRRRGRPRRAGRHHCPGRLLRLVWPRPARAMGRRRRQSPIHPLPPLDRADAISRLG